MQSENFVLKKLVNKFLVFFVDAVLKMCTKQVLNVIARILGPVIAIIDENSITPTEFRCQRFTFCN